jgi:DNA adenine methylase
MKGKALKAPFPAIGGKAKVAALVWSRIGDVDNFIEPFCNSAVVLLLRPHEPRVETVNDLNPYIANFWRATLRDADAVVEHCDWPVNETDLHARHRWLVLSPAAEDFRERMKADPEYFDARVAGWWVWGACCWIGGQWCEYRGGVNRRPYIAQPGTANGQGVHGAAKELPEGRPQLADAFDIGRGVCGTPPAGFPVKMPTAEQCKTGGKGVHGVGPDGGTCAERRAWLLDWFARLRDRLRNVRVCCGHWLRVCDSESVTTRLGTTGIFLDPPYPIHQKKREAGKGKGKAKASRSGGLYAGDDADALLSLRDEVLSYCQERGDHPMYRIAVCGYEGDGYESLEGLGWSVEHWRAHGGYANANKDGNPNRDRERIWFSPHCHAQRSLFDQIDDPRPENDPCPNDS